LIHESFALAKRAAGPANDEPSRTPSCLAAVAVRSPLRRLRHPELNLKLDSRGRSAFEWMQTQVASYGRVFSGAIVPV
jgi:hypothetical protein